MSDDDVLTERLMRLPIPDAPHGPANFDVSERTLRRQLEREGKALEPQQQTYDSALYVHPDSDGNPELDDTQFATVCEVCHLVLNRLSDFNNDLTWIHSRSWQKHDHDPVPIRVPRKSVEFVLCDFCGVESRLNWAYKGNHLQLEGNLHRVQDYGTMWGACDACVEIIDTGDLNTLANRLVTHSREFRKAPKYLQPEMLERTLALWGAFFANGAIKTWSGPPRQPARLDPRQMARYHQGLVKFWEDPSLYHQLSAHGKHNGQNLPAFCVDPERTDKFNYHVNAGEPLPEFPFHRFRAHIVTSLNTTIHPENPGLYWVNSNFTRIATLAAQDYTELHITRDQLPSAHGFLIFEEPIGVIQRRDGEAAIRAISWSLVPGGVWLNVYFQGEDADPYVDVTDMRSRVGWFLSPNPGLGFEFDKTIPISDDPAVSFVQVIFSTWMHITQPGVAEVQPAPVDKKVERAYKRATGKKLPEVRLVDLRRRPRRTGTGTGTGVTTGPRGPLTKTRYTPSHWRWQPYGPKRGQRKLIRISPYISGPDNGPIEVPPIVKVLR